MANPNEDSLHAPKPADNPTYTYIYTLMTNIYTRIYLFIIISTTKPIGNQKKERYASKWLIIIIITRNLIAKTNSD